jgi:hypothetical protein
MKQNETTMKIIEDGYRPIGSVNTNKPPQGGSGVPSKPQIIRQQIDDN